MIPLSSAIPRGLAWSKTPHTRGFELKSDGEIVASLWRTSFWSSEYRAKSQHGSWKFCRTGFFRTGVEVVDAISNARIATIRPNWSGCGTLGFADGQTFRLTSKGLCRPVWTVLADNGTPILNIHSSGKIIAFLDESRLQEDRLILLIVFCWHLMQQASEDASSVAAVVAATS